MARSFAPVAVLVLLAACRAPAPSGRPAETPRTADATKGAVGILRAGMGGPD